MARYDVAVIGSGPAGLEAAINLKIRNKSFILFGTSQLSHKIFSAPRIDNFLGLPAISGKELQARFLEHLSKMDIAISPEQIQMVYPMGDFFSLASGQNTYEADAVILATGAYTGRPLPGEDELLGKGVGYCATCDAPLYKGKTAAVLGYTEEAVHEAMYIAEIAEKVYFIPMKKLPNLPKEPVEVLDGTVTGIVGNDTVSSLELEGQSLPVDGVFILRDTVAPSSLVPGLALTGQGFIQVDLNMSTNFPGCYAAGDCTGKPHQYMRAAGQGQTAALNAAAYLDKRNATKK